MNLVHLKTLIERIQSSWFKICLAFLFIYVVSVKDLHFQFSLNNAQAIEQATAPLIENRAKPSPVVYKMEKKSTKKPSAKRAPASTFSMWDLLPFGRSSTKKEITKEEEEESTYEFLEEANDFSNLDFIMEDGMKTNTSSRKNKKNSKTQRCQEYLKRFAPVAIAEMKKYDIPASITLAQALLESNAGESKLTKKNGNHFGIKCFSKKCGKSHCSNFMDDGHKDFFRKYKNSWDSYRDHSLFLSKDRYKHLKKLNTDDYVGWARGLKKAGYATDKQYAEKLIRIIETFQLYKLDA